MLVVRVNDFWGQVLRFWSIMHITHRPDNSCAVPMFFRVICNFQKPWENFNDSESNKKESKMMKLFLLFSLKTFPQLFLLASTGVILLFWCAVRILILTESCYTSNSMLRVLIFDWNVPIIGRSRCAEDLHSTFDTSPVNVAQFFGFIIIRFW